MGRVLQRSRTKGFPLGLRICQTGPTSAKVDRYYYLEEPHAVADKIKLARKRYESNKDLQRQQDILTLGQSKK